MESKQTPWFRVGVLVAELALVAVAILFPLVISDDILKGLLRILELVAALK